MASKIERGSASKGGRPKAARVKEMVTMRLDPDVLAKLREAGPGWQTRVNALLREAVLPETVAP